MAIYRMLFSSVMEDIRRRPFNAAMIALTAMPACETAIRSACNIFYLASSNKDAALSYETGGNLIATAVLASCALDLFPGARPCGAIVFLFHSYFKGDNKSALLSSKPIYWCFNTVIFPINLRKITFVAALALSYFAYSHYDILSDKHIYEEIASKTCAMLSRVWLNE